MSVQDPVDYQLSWWLMRAVEAEQMRKHAADFCMTAGAATITAGWIATMVWFTPTSSLRGDEYVHGLGTALTALTAFLGMLWWFAANAEKSRRQARSRIEAEAYAMGFSVSGVMRHGFRVRT